ncbi:asparagine synthase [Sphingomonas melonis]|uniref:Asparagine synthase (Glutamine-hydrolyzing) n=1 Tax=Sphingomonas melonis TaxID=152682 RepID=A0A7Y9K1S3_9SPHN|nr:asparagine synthase [Sphingomonas melonis]NYD89194.1 asparagine synthase (glutamine-hydrolyzing) [Sphingomonas melonis]
MNPSFVAIAWSGPAGRSRTERILRQLSRRGLSKIHETSSLIVAASPGAGMERLGEAVLVIGANIGLSRLAGVDLMVPARSIAELLCSETWGSYIAFIDASDGPHVFVDPSGAGHATIASDGSVTLVADIIDGEMMDGAELPIRVDESALAGCLADPTTTLSTRLLEGVTRLVPGTLRRIDGGSPALDIWTPARTGEDRAAPADRLVSAVDVAIDGLCGTMPLVQLSGGLDSSIVATSTALHRRRVKAVTAVSAGGDVSEVQYARSAARHAGIELTEDSSDVYPSYRSFFDEAQIQHPFLHGLDDLFAKIVGEAAAREGADCVLTGQGGDAVFFQPASHSVTIDRMAALRMRGLAGLEGDAVRTRTTIWHHLLPVLSSLVRRPRLPRVSATPDWLSADARGCTRNPPHAWIGTSDALPIGKREQIMMLANAQIFHSTRPSSGYPPIIHPLLAQPVLETVLSIPSWMLSHGPGDRALARQAFSSRLPAPVSSRFAKGEATTFYNRSAVSNLPFLRDVLLGGALADAGIIDNDRMDETLTREHLFYDRSSHSLMLAASCEAWLRAWRR